MTRISDLASSLAAACLQRSYEDGKTISILALGIEFSKERESETVSDTEHNDNTFSNSLPDTIWAWTNSVGAQKWSEEKIVSHSREYIRVDQWLAVPEQFAAQVQPVLSDEDAQWLELKRLLQQTDMLVSAAVSNTEYDLRVDIKFGYESDHKPRFGTVADAITELQHRQSPLTEQPAAAVPDITPEERQVVELVRLAKELLRRDQAADTMDIALRIKDYSLVTVMKPGYLVGSLDYAIAELRERHLAADKHNAAGGEQHGDN